MGWKNGFVIDYVPYEDREGVKKNRSISCRDCKHYIDSDLSCSKTPRCFREDSWSSWKYCKYFSPYGETLDAIVNNKDYKEWEKRYSNIEKSKLPSTNISLANKDGKQSFAKVNNKTDNRFISNEEIKKLSLVILDYGEVTPAKSKKRYVKLYLDNGEKASICLKEKDGKVYLRKGRVNELWEQEAIRLFKK